MPTSASWTTTLPRQQVGELIPAQTIDGVVRAIAERFAPEKIVLFGSYVCGSPTPDSDLDLLIIMPTNQPRHKRGLPIHQLFQPYPCAMDFLVFTSEEVSYWYGTVNHIITNALQTGKVVYERTPP